MTTNLSFVVADQTGARRDLWAVSPSGDYADECATGRAYADEIRAEIEAGNPAILGHVVQAIAGRPWSGIEVGFFHRIAETSA
ncbi:MAG: hypothetical protein KF910_03690 [Brevundimonas sp.]|uniref:hypothetical protein n=1 Tax=Brevundimonas sp. TaxID=1871086 RepID=UPI0025B9AC85|nr:hypothetical protein [Brevundimonas sp.]MBX3476682.1 hypothetical protein [Brevundimonas sp.]